MSRPKPDRTLTTPDKFKILHRDEFTCKYCGAKPGSDLLEVDHLIPKSFGGSDHPLNLITACKKCNRSRRDQALFPTSMVIGTDSDGWQIIKVWGAWSIKACHRSVVVTGSVGYEYWFDIDRAHELDWVEHIKRKGWLEPHKLDDFIDCLEYARLVTDAPRARTPCPTTTAPTADER